jgi:hypothetical protein
MERRRVPQVFAMEIQDRRMPMAAIKKYALVAATSAALLATASASPASAAWGHHHGGGGWGWGGFGAGLAFGALAAAPYYGGYYGGPYAYYGGPYYDDYAYGECYRRLVGHTRHGRPIYRRVCY